MSRILFLGDLGTTGFGTVTKDLGGALLEIGEDVRFLSHYVANEEIAEPFFSRTISATGLVHVVDEITGQKGSAGSTDILGDILGGTSRAMLANGEPSSGWRPDAAILLGDFTAARMLVEPHWQAFTQMRGRLFHYVPIEGVQLPPFWSQLWSLLTPVAMSNFGADEIAKVIGHRPPMVYHGIDADAFHPATPRTPVVITPGAGKRAELTSKADCKRMWAAFVNEKLPRKWILRCDSNMPRKRQNSLIRAIAQVMYQQPDVALLMHTPQFGQGGYLPDMLSKLPGARPMTRGMDYEPPRPDAWALFGRPYPQVVITNQFGLPREALVSLYNAADLYVSTSAEGFGLTIAEALACGVPAVGVDFSAVPEVIGPAGEVIPVSYLVENMYDHYWCAIDEAKLAERVGHLMQRPTQRERLGRKGPPHVRENFRWDAAARQFSDIIAAAVNTPQEVVA